MLGDRSATAVRKIGLVGVSVADTGQALKMSDGAVRVASHPALKTLAILREGHVTLCRGGTTAPALAGLVAGLAGSGLAAAIYAVHCTEDSPLFYVTW